MSQSPAPFLVSGPSNALRLQYIQARRRMMEARLGMQEVVDKATAKIWIQKFDGVVVSRRLLLYDGGSDSLSERLLFPGPADGRIPHAGVRDPGVVRGCA
jgi:hypothetical protein